MCEKVCSPYSSSATVRLSCLQPLLAICLAVTYLQLTFPSFSITHTAASEYRSLGLAKCKSAIFIVCAHLKIALLCSSRCPCQRHCPEMDGEAVHKVLLFLTAPICPCLCPIDFLSSFAPFQSPLDHLFRCCTSLLTTCTLRAREGARSKLYFQVQSMLSHFFSLTFSS